METTIKAVIFDGDGMVINGEQFYMQLLRNFGSRAEVLNEFYINEFQSCLIGKADMKDEIKVYLEKFGYEQHTDDFVKHWFKSEHNTDDNIINVIHELRSKGIKCYLATNQEKYRAEYITEEMNFLDVFDKIFFSCKMGYIKPQIEFYEYIADDLKKEGIEKNEVLFWDDRSNNVEEANKNGFIGALYRNFDDFIETLKKHGLQE